MMVKNRLFPGDQGHHLISQREGRIIRNIVYRSIEDRDIPLLETRKGYKRGSLLP